MKRNKKIGVLLGILLCVSLAAFSVSKYEQQKEIIKNSDEIILEVDGEAVKTLSWECNTGDFAFHKDDSGSWLYDADEAFPVEEEKINELLNLFEEFGVSFRIEEVEDFAQYGLEEPVCTIRMETETQTYEILVGNYSEMDSERYVSIGDGNAYLVKEDPLDRYAVELSDLIRHDEIPAFEEVTQVQFSGAGSEKIVYEEDSGNTYSAEDVYFVERGEERLALDTTRVNDYLDTIKNLGLQDYVTYNASDEELATYGMDEPELSIQLDYAMTEEGSDEKTTGTFTLQIGRDPKEREMEEAEEEEAEEEEAEEVTAYARAGESRILYQITAQQYEKLMDMSYDTLRHQEMFWADFADMYQLTVSLEGETHTITSEMEGEERTWYYKEEELEMAGLRSAVRGLTAVSFTGEQPTQKEEISLTIYLDNENDPEVSIQLYRHDGDRCIAVVDGKATAFVERAKVVDLIEAVQGIVLEEQEAES